jgi:hypothetical protein
VWRDVEMKWGREGGTGARGEGTREEARRVGRDRSASAANRGRRRSMNAI